MEKLKIYARTIEDEAFTQIAMMNDSEAYKDSIIRIMPDAHAGIGCTIGTVIAIKDRIVPNTVGVDIGCGMLVICLGKQEIKFDLLDKVVNEQVPSGFNIHDNVLYVHGRLNNLHCKSAIDIDMANRSIGTLGGGNHFIEIDEDTDGNRYLVVHSGSRNLGVRVCKYYQELAYKNCNKLPSVNEIIQRLKAEGREKDIQSEIQKMKAEASRVEKELAYLEGPDMENYLEDMEICQRYAELNRMTIASIIFDALELSDHGTFETIHNYIDIEHKILRKGAVSALNGERLIIPMNMRDGSLICRGKGNVDWLYSAPHGAGRLMSRKKAKETLSMNDFQQSMDGIYTTSVCEGTIDEAPMAYKPMEEIMECIKPTVDIVSVIKPLYNFKAK